MIVITTQCFAPKIGGIEALMTGMAEAMSNAGKKVLVLADGKNETDDIAKKYEIIRFSGWKPLRRRNKANFLKISKKKIEKEFVSMASMNCWVYEEDIGKMCSFLISDDAERISGQVIGVDGNAIRLD